MPKTHAIGADLSYTASGIAWPTRDGTSTADTYTTDPKQPDPLRWAVIAGHVAAHAQTAALTVIEDVHANTRNPKTSIRLAKLHGAVHMWVASTTRTRIVLVAPKSLKKFATGNGTASKDEMHARAILELDPDTRNHNEADALWLRAIGQSLLGAGIVEHTDWRLEALDAIHWEGR